ncbi:hypothetical protein KIN20_015498 [Parelaphostrongylus tenuis]|uniref:Uncharacterized protein n=1 Tax=Parelaphostrongylus tenuis TaxID=148309 RepID=A0AAD5N0Q2_PARTN|nr:hypothetical protein KIN20_015498 [Parelaphostrongylus tenuis]
MISRMSICDGITALTVPEKPEEQPGHRGDFVDFTYKRFDGHTQKMRYSEMQKQSRGVASPGEEFKQSCRFRRRHFFP